MSTNSTQHEPYCFPTLPVEGYRPGVQLGVPVMPRSSIFQTVVEDLHVPEIEEVMSRPSWSYDDASLRVLDAMLDKGWAMHPGGVLVAPEPPKDRTKSSPTPSRKQARRSGKAAEQERVRAEREPGMRGSEGGCYS